jgi:hypothetical protein
LSQALRFNPRQPRRHITYNMLAHASFGAARYVDGAGWARRALNEMPAYPPPHLYLTICLVGMRQVDEAKATFVAGRDLAPRFFSRRLEDTPAYVRPKDRQRAVVFLRIAAGLEDPGVADPLR